MSIIEVKNLSKTFVLKDSKVEALKNINFEVEQGDIYGIIGMSGAGKSTLVRCLNFLERPTEGTVVVDGYDLAVLKGKELRDLRSSIGMIFQGFNLLMQSNVLENVCFPLKIHGMAAAEAKKRALSLLETVGLSDKAKAYPAQLSGGQKQRVAIARALASNPKILLCDEATSALDPQTTQQILELLRTINKETGITIIIITHSMSVVREICNHVAIVESGRIVEDGLVEEIFTHPSSDVARKLVFEGANIADGPVNEAGVASDRPLIRAVFSTNSSYEPVVANTILKFREPLNILGAHTLDVNGVARGVMYLELSETKETAEKQISYLRERGLQVEEIDRDVLKKETAEEL